MSLIFFVNNFYKNNETFKIFSPQLLEVYRILLVETTLELIMFYYTFSVINTLFVPCTALLYDSATATRTLKLSTTLLTISCGIHLVSPLVMSSLVCGLFSQTLPFRSPLENGQAGWDIGNRMARGYRFDVKWVCSMGSYAWSIQVFCSGWWFQMRWCLISRTGHLNTSGITSHGTDSFHVKPMTPGHPIPKISNCRLFAEGVPERQSLWKQSPDKRGHHQKRNQTDCTRNAQ